MPKSRWRGQLVSWMAVFCLFCSLCDFQEFLVSISKPMDLTLESLNFKQLCVSPSSSFHAHLLKREVELWGNRLDMLYFSNTDLYYIRTGKKKETLVN